MVIEISEMRPRDCEPVAALLQGTDTGSGVLDSPRLLLDALNLHPNISLVIRQDDAIVGAALCAPSPDGGTVQYVTLAKEYDSPQTQRLLVDALICKLERRHIPVAGLRMSHDTDEAENFWRSARWTNRPELPAPIQKCARLSDPTNPFDSACEFAAPPDDTPQPAPADDVTDVEDKQQAGPAGDAPAERPAIDGDTARSEAHCPHAQDEQAT